jgi:hypothetical protein
LHHETNEVRELRSGDTEPYFLLGPVDQSRTFVVTAVGPVAAQSAGMLVARGMAERSLDDFWRSIFVRNQWPLPAGREFVVTGECGDSFALFPVADMALKGRDTVCPLCKAPVVFTRLRQASAKPGVDAEVRQNRQQMFDYLGHAVAFMRDEPDWNEMLFGEEKGESGPEMGKLEFSNSEEYWRVIQGFYGT